MTFSKMPEFGLVNCPPKVSMGLLESALSRLERVRYGCAVG